MPLTITREHGKGEEDKGKAIPVILFICWRSFSLQWEQKPIPKHMLKTKSGVGQDIYLSAT